MAIAFTGMFLSSSDVNGKLPPLPTWERADTMVSLMAGPEGKPATWSRRRALAIRPRRSMTMFTVFWPDQGGWKATVTGHQPFSFSHATDLSETLLVGLRPSPFRGLLGSCGRCKRASGNR